MRRFVRDFETVELGQQTDEALNALSLAGATATAIIVEVRIQPKSTRKHWFAGAYIPGTLWMA